MTANTLTIAAARDALRKREISAVDLTMACLTAIDAGDGLNAFVHKTPEIALDQARAADARLAAGDAPAMCGIPLGIKDLFCTKGVPSQAASNILRGFRPEYESTVTAKLFDAGAVMLGKLNMDEFAMGSSNETSCYGNAVNPWKVDDRKLTPGGSSGGSAAAVAADLCLGATGTDTGGSIRQPAAFTGITGIKPTYGRVSRWGIVAFASSLDQAGPMTKSVRDAAIFLQAMAGHDPKDSTSADIPVPDFEAALTGDIRGRVIGIPREYRMDGMPAEIEALWARGIEMLRDAGAVIRDISLPHTKYALPAYYVIAPAEASSEPRPLRRGEIRPSRASVAGRRHHRDVREDPRRRVRAGSAAPDHGGHLCPFGGLLRRLLQPRPQGARPDQARFRNGLRRRGGCDPDARNAQRRLRLGEMANASPVEMYLNDVFTVTVNLAGLPGVAVPVGLDAQGLPLGLQLIGRPWDEGSLLNHAYVLERAAGFVAKPEKWW